MTQIRKQFRLSSDYAAVWAALALTLGEVLIAVLTFGLGAGRIAHF